MHFCNMGKHFETRMEAKLDRRKKKGTYRRLTHFNDSLIDFSSNDYLGFSTDGLLSFNEHPQIVKYSGATASRLISGNHPIHEIAEKEIAEFHNAEAGLLFNSGYDANVGLLGCIARKGDTILYDEYSHASIRDGINLSLGTSISYAHNDMKDLRKKLESSPEGIFIVTEGLFSMDGDTSPLDEIVSLAEEFKAGVIIDEAHSNGILGTQGKGWVSSLTLEDKILARVHTFGKAMGCHGAIVLGSKTLRNYLINYARSFIFTTGIPPHSVMYIRKAYEKLVKTNRIKILNDNILFFLNSLDPLVRSSFLESKSPIQSLIIPGESEVRNVAERLQSDGFDVRPIVSPTVPSGKERIRICLHAFNSKEEIKGLANALNHMNING